MPGCDRALFDKEVAIPLAASSWPKDDVVKEINCLTAAVPVRVALHDLMEPDVYSGAETRKLCEEFVAVSMARDRMENSEKQKTKAEQNLANPLYDKGFCNTTV